MAEELVKVCKCCKKTYPAWAVLCDNGTDISAVQPTYPSSDGSGEEESPKELAGDVMEVAGDLMVGDMVIWTSQGEERGPLEVDGILDEDHVTVKGSKTGIPIKQITIVPPDARAVLELVVGGKSFECKKGDILGRGGTLENDRFRHIETVSRKHLLLDKVEESWRVKVPEGVRNETTLNGNVITREIWHDLKEGRNELTLSRKCEITLRLIRRSPNDR